MLRFLHPKQTPLKHLLLRDSNQRLRQRPRLHLPKLHKNQTSQHFLRKPPRRRQIWPGFILVYFFHEKEKRHLKKRKTRRVPKLRRRLNPQMRANPVDLPDLRASPNLPQGQKGALDPVHRENQLLKTFQEKCHAQRDHPSPPKRATRPSQPVSTGAVHGAEYRALRERLGPVRFDLKHDSSDYNRGARLVENYFLELNLAAIQRPGVAGLAAEGVPQHDCENLPGALTNDF